MNCLHFCKKLKDLKKKMVIENWSSIKYMLFCMDFSHMVERIFANGSWHINYRFSMYTALFALLISLQNWNLSNGLEKTLNQIYLFELYTYFGDFLYFKIYLNPTTILEYRFSFSEDISPFYVMIYNSKTGVWILNTMLDFNLELEF